MTGILLAFLAAAAESFLNVVVNKYKKGVKPMTMGFGQLLLVLPVAAFMLWRYPEFPDLSVFIWVLFLVFGVINVLGRVLYIKAVHHSGLSKTVPFLSFTPVFLIIYGLFDPTETLKGSAIIGVLLIVVGTFVISINNHSKGSFSPFQFLKKEKGSQLALLTALVYSCSSLITRKIQLEVGPEHKTLFFYIVVVLQFFIFWGVAFRESREIGLFKVIKNNMNFFIPAAILLGIMELCFFTSLVYVEAAIAISIKRTAILLSIIWGFFLFKEQGFTKNLFAAFLMVLGVVVILLT